MTEAQFRRELIDQLRRIADALETANRNDPLAMIQQALEAEQGVPNEGPLTDIKLGPHHVDDLPPAQRRAMGLED